MPLPLRNTLALTEMTGKYKLSSSAMRRGFLYFYRGRHRKNPFLFMQSLWLKHVFRDIEVNNPLAGNGIAALFRDSRMKALSSGIKVHKDYNEGVVLVDVPLMVLDCRINAAPPTVESPFDPADNLKDHIQYLVNMSGQYQPEGTAKARSFSPMMVVNCMSTLMEHRSTNYADLFGVPIEDESTLNEEFIKQCKLRLPEGRIYASASDLDPEVALYYEGSYLGLRITNSNDVLTVYANFKITKDEAQLLCNASWPEVRPMDIASVLSLWVSSNYEECPINSTSLSAIANTLPKDCSSSARVNENHISLSPEGRLALLPVRVRDADMYERTITEIGHRDGLYDTNRYGYFCIQPLEDLVSENKRAKLPVNMPVMVDWINRKFVFTNTVGALQVLDLAAYQKPKDHQIKSVLSRKYGMMAIRDLIDICAAAFPSIPTQLTDLNTQDLNDPALNGGYPTFTLMTPTMSVRDYFNKCIRAHNYDRGIIPIPVDDDGNPKPIEDGASDVSALMYPSIFDTYPDNFNIFRPLYDWFKAHAATVISNKSAVFEKYSIEGSMERLGGIIAVNDHLFKTTVTEFLRGVNAHEEFVAMTNTGLPNPDVDVTNVAYFDFENIGYLPHQKRILGQLSYLNPLAALPVSAGGGKTPIVLSDIIRLIMSGLNTRYLVMCPPHLVSQYVSEINYFTKGSFNAIPVSTRSLKSHGVARLTSIIEKAPINTVVIVSYDTLRNGQKQICYGTKSVTSYPVIEFLRQFNFGYVAMDESHYLKNKSNRTDAASFLVSETEYRRIASGTMNHVSPADLAMQFALVDPALLGSMNDFIEAYAANVSSSGVITEWKEGAIDNLNATIRTRVTVAGATQREWAAILPPEEEAIYQVELTPNQRTIYNSILESTLEEIKKNAETNKLLRAFIDGNLDMSNEDQELMVASTLRPYLARLEQFTTAPDADETGDKMLQGDDRVSNKAKLLYERMRQHLAENGTGKCLIFLNYEQSVLHVMRNMPEDLKAMTIHYTAANKTSCVEKFNNDDTLPFMVGISQSMDTGLNLQIAYRLIRLEYPYVPGTLKQGNARLQRPSFKLSMRRAKIVFEWIVANCTVDCTKVSRLISRLLTVEVFDNASNPLYKQVPILEVVPMTLDSIRDNNDWATSMRTYNEAYAVLREVRAKDYEAYKNDPRNAFEFDEKGDVLIRKVTPAPMPDGSMVYMDTPYIQGMEVARAADHGLVRLDTYLRADSEADEEVNDDDYEGDEDEASAIASLDGLPVHTEFGEANVIRIINGGSTVRVRLLSDPFVNIPTSMVFLKPDAMNGSCVRKLNAGLVNLQTITYDHPIPEGFGSWLKTSGGKAYVAAYEARNRKSDDDYEGEDETPRSEFSCELEWVVTNGYLALRYYLRVGEENMVPVLSNVGFERIAEFQVDEIFNAATLKDQMQRWDDAGFTLDPAFHKAGIRAAIADLYREIKSGSLRKNKNGVDYATRNNLRNVYKLETRANPEASQFKPYPMIENGKAYLMLPVRGQAGTKAALSSQVNGIKLRSSRTQWELSRPSMMFFADDKAEFFKALRNLTEMGVEIRNIEKLRDTARKFKDKVYRGEAADVSASPSATEKFVM